MFCLPASHTSREIISQTDAPLSLHGHVGLSPVTSEMVTEAAVQVQPHLHSKLEASLAAPVIERCALEKSPGFELTQWETLK